MTHHQTKILSVDDDPAVCNLIERALRGSGYGAVTVNSAEEAWKRVPECSLVLLDINLGDCNGIDLARELRHNYPNIGIIMVSGLMDTVERIVSLEVGADDYICKPFDSREVVARVKSLLRRLRYEVSQLSFDFRFLEYKVDLESYKVLLRDEEIALTGSEFKLLAMMVQRPYIVHTREAICREVFEREWYPDDRTVDVLVSKLRKKIELDGIRIIKALRGVGYKFCANVERLRR